ncbi:MAG: TolC family protein [Syntrophomonadaceae bacterium]|nr:TolC family protein [Syntrophomonadaceae bacterium]
MVRLVVSRLRRSVAVWILTVCFVGVALVLPVMAKEPATPQLSLEEAIKLALAHAEDVKNAAKDIERTEEWRNYRADKLDYTPTEPPGNPAVEIAWAQLLTADLQWRMSKKALTVEQDATVLDTCKKYWDVLKAQEAVKAAETSLANARRQLQKARASYQVEMVPYATLVAAEVQYKAAEASLAAARNALDNAYAAFNQLVGLWAVDRPVLTDTVEFNSLQVDDLDTEVNRIVDACPTVWLAQEKVTLQKYLEDMMFYTGEYRPYQARKIEVEQAELDAASTRKLFDLTTRSLYYSVKGLEEKYAAAVEKARLAEENLKVVKAKYDVGLVTAADVSAAEKELADAQYGQYGVFELACQHAYYKLAFQKPWAYLSSLSVAGGSSAASSSASGSTGQ